MKLFAVVLGALALLAGFTGGMRAYSTSAHAGPTIPTAHVAVRNHPAAQVVRPGPVMRWAPCRAPAVRRGRSCVTTVVHQVALPAPTASAPTTSAPAPRHVRHTRPGAPATPTPPPSDDGGHHHGDHGGDDGGGHDD